MPRKGGRREALIYDRRLPGHLSGWLVPLGKRPLVGRSVDISGEAAM